MFVFFFARAWKLENIKQLQYICKCIRINSCDFRSHRRRSRCGLLLRNSSTALGLMSQPHISKVRARVNVCILLVSGCCGYWAFSHTKTKTATKTMRITHTRRAKIDRSMRARTILKIQVCGRSGSVASQLLLGFMFIIISPQAHKSTTMQYAVTNESIWNQLWKVPKQTYSEECRLKHALF